MRGNEVVWHQTASGKWSMTKPHIEDGGRYGRRKADRFENSYTSSGSRRKSFTRGWSLPIFCSFEKRIAKFEFRPATSERN